MWREILVGKLLLKFTDNGVKWDIVNDEFIDISVNDNVEIIELNKSIDEFCIEAFETAKSKGWHDQPRSFGEFISLVHAEVSEALEADRRNEGKERVAEELADVLIRIFDGAIEFDLDVETAILTKMAYNRTRSYKHGGKKY
jgi:NTP pyrophosphatase (non-canonical NTP hydrolase)